METLVQNKINYFLYKVGPYSTGLLYLQSSSSEILNPCRMQMISLGVCIVSCHNTGSGLFLFLNVTTSFSNCGKKYIKQFHNS